MAAIRAACDRESSDAGLPKYTSEASFDTVNSFAGLDHIQVNLHDPLFAPDEFDQCGEIDLKPFPEPRPLRPEKNILGGLLGDGAGTPHLLSLLLLVIFLCLLDGFKIKSPVFGEFLSSAATTASCMFWEILSSGAHDFFSITGSPAANCSATRMTMSGVTGGFTNRYSTTKRIEEPK